MTARKPLIALTPNYNIEKEETYMRPAYIRAIQHAGGIPVTLPLNNTKEDLKQLAREFDGFLFTGGPDVHSFYFGEETHAHCGNVSPKRDTLELALLKLVLEMKKPVLGICRGIQLFNIGLGGDIYQDLPSQFPQKFPVAHSQPFYYDIPSHTVEVVPGTILEKIVQNAKLKAAHQENCHDADDSDAFDPLSGGCTPGILADSAPDYGTPGTFADPAPDHRTSGTFADPTPDHYTPVISLASPSAASTKIQVNSMHHQAVRKVAPGLIASGYALEGLVEALEMPDYPGFFLGVQWHPEYLWEKDGVAAGIFQYFVNASRASSSQY